MIKITHLADCPETIPTLTRWFIAQWPDYFSKLSSAEIKQGFQAEAQRNQLPIRLLAFINDELAGTIALRDKAIRGLPEFHPGLGGLLVLEKYRRQGAGTELVNAGMNVARNLGFEHAYATTINARGILESLGWQFVQTILHEGEELSLYQCDL